MYTVVAETLNRGINFKLVTKLTKRVMTLYIKVKGRFSFDRNKIFSYKFIVIIFLQNYTVPEVEDITFKKRFNLRYTGIKMYV